MASLDRHISHCSIFLSLQNYDYTRSSCHSLRSRNMVSLSTTIDAHPNFGDVNRRFPAKRSKYWNIHIIKITASIITKCCRVIETLSTLCWWSKCAPNKSKMVDGCHLEKIKNILISSQPINQFWQNVHADASWPPGPHHGASKILWFRKSKMAASAIQNFFKNLSIYLQCNDLFWRILAQWCD